MASFLEQLGKERGRTIPFAPMASAAEDAGRARANPDPMGLTAQPPVGVGAQQPQQQKAQPSAGGGKGKKKWKPWDEDWEKMLLNLGLRLMASPGGMGFGQELGHAGIGAMSDFQAMEERRRRTAADEARLAASGKDLMTAADGTLWMFDKNTNGITRVPTPEGVSFDRGGRELGIKDLMYMQGKYGPEVVQNAGLPVIPGLEKQEGDSDIDALIERMRSG